MSDVASDDVDVLLNQAVLLHRSQVISCGEVVDERVAHFDDQLLKLWEHLKGDDVWHVGFVAIAVHPAQHTLSSVCHDVELSDRLLLYRKQVASPVECFNPVETKGVVRERDERGLGVNLSADLQESVSVDWKAVPSN
jgi:hypothetical protein